MIAVWCDRLFGRSFLGCGFCLRFFSVLNGLSFSLYFFLSFLCYSFGFSGVDFFLSLEAGLCVGYFLLSLFFEESVKTLLSVGFPSIETTLCFGFVECAFLDTTKEVFHKQNALVREDVAYCVGRLRTAVEPIKSALEFEVNSCGVGVRVVRTDTFNVATITWCFTRCNHDVVVGVAFTTVTLQSHFNCHVVKFLVC